MRAEGKKNYHGSERNLTNSTVREYKVMLNNSPTAHGRESDTLCRVQCQMSMKERRTLSEKRKRKITFYVDSTWRSIGFRCTSPRVLSQLLSSCSASKRTLATCLHSHSVPSPLSSLCRAKNRMHSRIIDSLSPSLSCLYSHSRVPPSLSPLCHVSTQTLVS